MSTRERYSQPSLSILPSHSYMLFVLNSFFILFSVVGRVSRNKWSAEHFKQKVRPLISSFPQNFTVISWQGGVVSCLIFRNLDPP